MLILQLHNHHAGKGGAMEVLENERQLLEAAGHTVHQYTLRPAEELNLSGVTAGAKSIWNREAYRDVSRLLETRRTDIVHVHTPFPLMSPAVFRAAQRHRVPTVATLHSFRYSCIAATCYRDDHPCEDCVGTMTKWPGVRHRCYHSSLGASAALTTSLVVHRVTGTFRGSVDRFVALTEFSKRLLIRDGVPADKITVKPNSVADPGELRGVDAPLGPPYVAFAGRLLDVKGVDTLLEAWRLAEPIRLRMRIAGDGPLRGEVQAAADRGVDYLGWLSEGDVTALFAGAEAVIVPSRWYEGGQPLVTLRSLSVGTPVVISDFENLTEDVIPSRAGMAFTADDPESLAGIIRRVDRDPSIASSLRSNARAAYLRRYTPTQNLAGLERTYQEIAGGR